MYLICSSFIGYMAARFKDGRIEGRSQKQPQLGLGSDCNKHQIYYFILYALQGGAPVR